MRRIAPDAWLDRRDAEHVRLLFEDSRHLPNYRAVLTLLWIAELEAGGLRAEMEDLLPELDPEEFTLRRKQWPR